MDEPMMSAATRQIGVQADDVLRPANSGQPPAESPMLDGDVLAEAVLGELRDDSTTAALPIEVEVWDRVVHVRGAVAQASEAEAAEIVAARVHGVGLVADDLEMPRAPAPEIGISE